MSKDKDSLKIIDIGLTKEERDFLLTLKAKKVSRENLSFRGIGKDLKKSEKLQILSEVELLAAQKRKRKFKISKKDLDNFKL